MMRSRWVLHGSERLIMWAQMSFNPEKSRSLVVKRLKVTDQFHFSLQDIKRQSVPEKV